MTLPPSLDPTTLNLALALCRMAVVAHPEPLTPEEAETMTLNAVARLIEAGVFRRGDMLMLPMPLTETKE